MNTTNTIIENEIPGSPGSSLARSKQIPDLQSPTINQQSAPPSDACEKIRNPQPPIRTSKVIDTWDIPFPKTLTERHALDATRETPYLKALCNRRQIHTPGKNPTPAEIIPIIQKILDRHLTLKPKGAFETSDITVEWKLIRDDLTEFLTNLRALLPCDINSR